MGDEANIQVVDGDRIEFGPANWNQPQKVMIVVHKNLPKPIVASLRVASGNIPLAWAICIGVTGAVYLLLTYLTLAIFRKFEAHLYRHQRSHHTHDLAKTALR